MNDSSPSPAEDGAPDNAREQVRGMVHTLRRGLRELGTSRIAILVVFLIVALLIARFSWYTPLLQNAERALYDLRAGITAPVVEKDERIVMIVYDEQTLRLTGQRSPVDRTVLAQALKNIDAANPKAVGIDIFFDMEQDDDELLKSSLRAMQTPTYLAYADPKTNEEITYEQEQFLSGFHATLKGTKVGPTSIRIDSDSDDVARSWTAMPKGAPPFFAIALAGKADRFGDYDGAILYHVPEYSDTPVFDKFPIEQLADPEMGPAIASFLTDKYVLIGGSFIDRDRFETPVGFIEGTSGEDRKMIGLEVHAHMLAQLLDDQKPAPIPGWVLWIVAIVVAGAGGISALLVGNPYKTGAIITVQLIIFIALPFVLQAKGIDTLGLPAFGGVVGWLFGYAAVGSAVRTVNAKQRHFAQSALGKYLPKSVANEIMNDPGKLALTGEKREIFAVFTDLEGFTKLSHAIEPEMVALLLNDYLDRLADVVLEHGGTLDKFVGDAVVAFWGAPISRPDDGEKAARAALAMYEAGEDFRRNVPEGCPPVGRTRVGMHYGPAIVGNFGGEDRIQYTAFGDSMNTAARLEAANKALRTTVLVSKEAAERTGMDWFRPMGKITLRGRSTPVEIFEPRPDWDAADREKVSEIIAAHAKGEQSAVQMLDAMVQRYGDDLGLANLLERLNATKQGESYALG